jgi:hypothetical protein
MKSEPPPHFYGNKIWWEMDLHADSSVSNKKKVEEGGEGRAITTQ